MADQTQVEQAPQRISKLRDQLKLLADYLDPSALERELAAFEGEMQKPGFWDDQERAASLSAKHSRAKRRLDRYRKVESELDDLEALVPLADEDEALREEFGEQLEALERELAQLEEERLFQGRYDEGDAVVTVHSGAGGTDSQDWAEMLLRMYLRWAQRRGFEAEMKEAAPGEEAGIKSATFLARGENAYGLFSG